MIRTAAKHMLSAQFPSGGVVYDCRSHTGYVLNAAAFEIWKMCCKPQKMASIVRVLCAAYGIKAAKAKRDAAIFIDELKKRKLIYVDKN